jgi:hypothetical protein
MWFLTLILGVAIGFFFKPQIDKGVRKVVRMIKDNRSDHHSSYE